MFKVGNRQDQRNSQTCKGILCVSAQSPYNLLEGIQLPSLYTSTDLPRGAVEVWSKASHLLSCEVRFISRFLFHVPNCRQVVRAIPKCCDPCAVAAESHIRVPEVRAAKESTA